MDFRNFDYGYPFRVIAEEVNRFRGRQRRKRELKVMFSKKYRRLKRKNPKTVFLVLTPEHENLGDHAIAFAETELLKKLGIDYVEITGRQLEELQAYHLLGIMNRCPILINGGGNLGTLWLEVERIQQQIIQNNPDSLIVILPNTIFYEDSAWGRFELEKSEKVFNGHKKLLLYAREPLSYRIMKQAYHNVKLSPDMVLFLNKSEENMERHGCLLCLRKDIEKIRTEEEDIAVLQSAEQLFPCAVKKYDTIAEQCISIKHRKEALEKTFKSFSGAELVITDRLHGMIFCAITGTPCVVLDSKSPKLRGCYEWIKDLEYIRFIEDASQIAETYRQIPKKTFHYDERRFEKEYQELANDILSIFSKGEKPWLK